MITPEHDGDYEIADLIEAVLRRADAFGMTPSTVARKAKISYTDAQRVLRWMVTEQYAHTSGQGAWKHYHAGRAAS